jgi:hypothetical protein
VSQPPARDLQEAPITRTVQQHLRDGQADKLSISDSWSAPRSTPGHKEVVGKDVKSDEERVETGVHEASKVDVASATPVFDTSIAAPGRSPANSESII